MSKNNNKTLSWDAFQSLGNPNNPELEIVKEDEPDKMDYNHLMDVRIWLDKKNRKGKKATLIKGLELNDDALSSLCKELKSKCGVGGAAKDGEIIIQGDNRKKVMEILIEKGYTKSKLAGG
tara:strand:+ start:49 stop:411 length:363 start_codon:yes stop_codon:yes gene_type:complete